MALCRLPTPPYFASRTHPLPNCSSRTLLLVCGAKNLRVGRKSRASKSNDELCDELREFILVAGFPENHVPSTKELLDHGRKELAYIVRRRGHREIAKLLANPRVDFPEEFTEGQVTRDLQSQVPGDTQGVDLLIPSASATPHIEDEVAELQVSIPHPNERSSVRSAVLYRENAMPSEISDADSGENFSLDGNTERPDHAKVNHLRELLKEKELELSLLKQQLEEEKLALTAMQAKFQSELNKVQDTISCKDQELQEAEEGLAGLKEVLLEYRGYAETVEVTGSFNGWQHKLPLYCQAPSKSVDTGITREATVWSTVLWLYPGVYEIKFIVDGHWVIDPQREFVSRDNIVNNILRVDEDGDPRLR